MNVDSPVERARERVGSVLNDKWTLERLIGVGGMAAVYAGAHRNGARAAIKILHPSIARHPEVRARFLREGYAANRVSHSGAVKVLDDDLVVGGPDDGAAFLVMELLEGQSLEDRLARGPAISEREVLAIMRAVLDVLEVAHKAGVVHRDLKPENIFLARDPEKPDAPPKIKILDFGLARMTEGSGKTMAGVAIGTPSYMSPEQAAGRASEIDGRSDLFGLGASCFRILAGRTVHPAQGALAICERMAKEPAPKLRSVAPQVSFRTAALIDRALAFQREERWPDAAAMRAAVDEAVAALGGETIVIDSGMIEVAERLEPRHAAPPPPEKEPPAEKRPSPPPRPPEPRQGASVFFWLIVLAITASVVTLVYRSLTSPPAAVVDAGSPPIASSAPSAAPAEQPVVDASTQTTEPIDASSDATTEAGAQSLDASAQADALGAETVDANAADAASAAAEDASLAPIDAAPRVAPPFPPFVPDGAVQMLPR